MVSTKTRRVRPHARIALQATHAPGRACASHFRAVAVVSRRQRARHPATTGVSAVPDSTSVTARKQPMPRVVLATAVATEPCRVPPRIVSAPVRRALAVSMALLTSLQMEQTTARIAPQASSRCSAPFQPIKSSRCPSSCAQIAQKADTRNARACHSAKIVPLARSRLRMTERRAATARLARMATP